MRKNYLFISVFAITVFISIAFKNVSSTGGVYISHYLERLDHLKRVQHRLLDIIKESDLHKEKDVALIRRQIGEARLALKGMDLWLRYLEPVSYKKINGPLPVEWETEVFEKFEKPYKREGAGLTLATLYLDEAEIEKDSLMSLIQQSISAIGVYDADSITKAMKSPDHFFLCNRLFLLNLAAIYTTGFECPDTSMVIPELRAMLSDVQKTYRHFNESFPETRLPDSYLSLYGDMVIFAGRQSSNYSAFDHFTFIRDYVNPLFAINQDLIRQFNVSSRSYVDYSLNKKSTSIFSKDLYHGQNPRGIFLRVKDEAVLTEIDRVGKLLFYDPILSGNNERSCASCHKPTQHFTDTAGRTALQFNRTGLLARNSPSLLNVEYQHLVMLDGKHISLQHQTKGVILNPAEMGSSEKEAVEKVLSCREYNAAFKKLLKYTPQEKEVTFDHVVSAITFYYSKFSKYYAPFDEAMNRQGELESPAKEGFNLFMSKAQCATCHFVPQFNGVKPPYTNSEFEVLGVPGDSSHKYLSADKGRHEVNAAHETMNAFRTGSVRNAAYTKPYMHNGVFSSLSEVIDFYNEGGGAGRGLEVNNQTLSSDPLGLTSKEKAYLIAFINSLNEKILFENPPAQLPASKNKMLNGRIVGGVY